MELYQVIIRRYSEESLNQIKQNLRKTGSHIKEYPCMVIVCEAGGHEYYLSATDERDAIEKVSNNKLELPCDVKKKDDF